MTLAQVRTLRITVGATAAIAVGYGMAWPMHFLLPLFAVMFLAMPGPWFGWKMAMQIIRRLVIGLGVGLVISEYFLGSPLLCVPLYALLFFYIYYNDATAPPMATILMTIGVTMVPIIALQATMASHMVVGYLFLNMFLGFVFTWLGHLILPNTLAKADPNAPPKKRPSPPPIPPREERARLALISTAISTTAVLLFFAFNMAQYALAMVFICIMAGKPNTNASVAVMRANSIACCIGGAAIVIAYNLLVAVPEYDFLIALSFCFALFFASKMNSGKPSAASWTSGFTTFLVLLGSSTGVDTDAAANFYLRIAQILFAGLFCIGGIIVVEHLLERRKRPRRKLLRRSANG